MGVQAGGEASVVLESHLDGVTDLGPQRWPQKAKGGVLFLQMPSYCFTEEGYRCLAENFAVSDHDRLLGQDVGEIIAVVSIQGQIVSHFQHWSYSRCQLRLQ